MSPLDGHRHFLLWGTILIHLKATDNGIYVRHTALNFINITSVITTSFVYTKPLTNRLPVHSVVTILPIER